MTSVQPNPTQNNKQAKKQANQMFFSYPLTSLQQTKYSWEESSGKARLEINPRLDLNLEI